MSVQFRDLQCAFENAIDTGFFYTSRSVEVGSVMDDIGHVRNWMYMYSKSEIDYFKNKNTRQYIEVINNNDF